MIIVIIIRYLDKSNRNDLKKNLYIGVAVGIAISFLVGGGLYLLSQAIGPIDHLENIWAGGASLVALALVTTFIIWMIKNGANMAKQGI